MAGRGHARFEWPGQHRCVDAFHPGDRWLSGQARAGQAGGEAGEAGDYLIINKALILACTCSMISEETAAFFLALRIFQSSDLT